MIRWEEAQTKANVITSKWELYHNSYAKIYGFLHFCPTATQRLLMAYIEYKVKDPCYHNYKSSKTITPPIWKTTKQQNENGMLKSREGPPEQLFLKASETLASRGASLISPRRLFHSIGAAIKKRAIPCFLFI